MKTRKLTLNDVAKVMLGSGLSFKDTYWEELRDCVPDLIEYIKEKAPGGLTKAMIERNGFKKWEPCLRDAPSITDNSFGRIVLDAWVRFFFDYPEIMELVGIITEQENPGADSWAIEEMKTLKTGMIVVKSNEKGPLTGMKIVFTGASSYFKGEAMERFLEKNGALTSHTVTSNTELLITGARPAYSKMVKAKNNKIRIITEEDFMEEFKGQLIGLPQ